MKIDNDKCIGCGMCIDNCNQEAIDSDKNHHIIINNFICVNCGDCKSNCPGEAFYNE